jgi:drug/metabolite transporter (DMT)-like permease
MSGQGRPLGLKTVLLGAVVVVSNVAGNALLSRGLKGRVAIFSSGPLGWVELLLNPWVCVGISLLIVWTLSRMTLLSWADLSYVLPLTASGYVLTVLAGRVLLAEQVSWQRWAGSFLIVAGAALVGGTPIRTTRRRRKSP